MIRGTMGSSEPVTTRMYMSGSLPWYDCQVANPSVIG
ncbi:hypothetical protein HNR25_004862 [Streptomonospora salina]|uniref:Uncharacterized protein n=1 Tax=Streptomonospora salina TaxID=104205 RepID=A0A841EJ19_9ACTN|nr:hypothetical protein [Streptomonospora salina]